MKSAGRVLLGIVVMAAVLLLGVTLTLGAAWVSAKVYPWLMLAAVWTFAGDAVLLLPLSFVRRARGATAGAFLASAAVFGLANWLFGLLTAYRLWGLAGAGAGLLLAGIGVAPVAMLAAGLHREWTVLESLIGSTLLWGAALLMARFLARRSVSEQGAAQAVATQDDAHAALMLDTAQQLELAKTALRHVVALAKGVSPPSLPDLDAKVAELDIDPPAPAAPQTPAPPPATGLQGILDRRSGTSPFGAPGAKGPGH